MMPRMENSIHSETLQDQSVLVKMKVLSSDQQTLLDKWRCERQNIFVQGAGIFTRKSETPDWLKPPDLLRSNKDIQVLLLSRYLYYSEYEMVD